MALHLKRADADFVAIVARNFGVCIPRVISLPFAGIRELSSSFFSFLISLDFYGAGNSIEHLNQDVFASLGLRSTNAFEFPSRNKD
jgi:hypothetical protein